MRVITLVICSFLAIASVRAQSVTGSWYGRADVEAQGSFSNYLTELVIRQKGDEVEGIFGYYFKNSYQSFFIRGSYDKKTREIYIPNLPMLHYTSTAQNGIECPMQLTGTLLVSKVRNTIKGYFFTDDRYKYTCPEMRVSMIMDESETNQDSVLRNTVAGRKLWQPAKEDFVVSSPTVTAAPITTRSDSSTAPTPLLPEVSVSARSRQKMKDEFEKRKNTLMDDLEIEGDSIRVSFYDNGDIDGDSISVFLNHEPVLVNQELSNRALNLYLALDKNREVNEISMLALNLGKYPPNTALMVVNDGVHRYEVYLSSSLTQNAAVRLHRKKKSNTGPASSH